MPSWLARLFGASQSKDYINGSHGLNVQKWHDRAKAEARWRQFEEAGPEYALPVKATHCPEGIPSCIGTFYAALYPASKFEDLLDFDLFQRYSSSIQQELIQSGVVDREWFCPPTLEDAMSRLPERLDRLSKCDELSDITTVLQNMEIPSSADWVLDLTFSAWTVSWGTDGLEAVATTEDGFLTLFAVDDE